VTADCAVLQRRRRRSLVSDIYPKEAIMDVKGKRMKVVIVGGVAGGASCAARLRRL
jgi:hypothetical protein